MEELHKPVKFFPILIHIKVDYLPGHVSCLLANDDVEILALVNTHEAGTIIVLCYPFAATERQDSLDGKPVGGFHISYPYFEIVEVGEVICGPELVKDIGRINEVRKELAVVATPLIVD
jgi:hypothetical protein